MYLGFQHTDRPRPSSPELFNKDHNASRESLSHEYHDLNSLFHSSLQRSHKDVQNITDVVLMLRMFKISTTGRNTIALECCGIDRQTCDTVSIGMDSQAVTIASLMAYSVYVDNNNNNNNNNNYINNTNNNNYINNNNNNNNNDDNNNSNN